MKREFLGLAAAIFTVAMCAPAFAQQPLPQSLGGEAAFHNFLENHPHVRADLVRDPNLVNDPRYLQAHPQFNAFYQEHPEVRTELGENAPEFMRREEWGFKHPGQYSSSNATWRHEAREQATDSYFDSHPQVEHALQQNPALANNPEFLKQHPGLARFEHTHPAIAQQLRAHPRKFMNSQENYDQGEHR